MFAMPTPRTENDRKVFLVSLVGMVALAWVALGAWGHSPHSRFLDHHNLDEIRDGRQLLSVYVGGWSLMTVAMMLPTSLPLINLFYALMRRHRNRVILASTLVLGYVATWTLFGAALFGFDALLHELVDRVAAIHAGAWLFTPATLALAGLYQFSSLKYRCLEQCRSPLSFISAHWHGRNERWESLLLGVRHGAYCVGCCWPLMLVMFAVGVGSVAWMLALGSIMAAEKNLPWGKRLSGPAGSVLLGAAWLALIVAPT